jgi:hypothetical protein
MQTQEYVEPAKKFTNRDLPAAVSAASRLRETTHSWKVPLSPPACVIDFYQAADRITPEAQDSSNEIEIDLKASSAVGHRLPAVQRVDHLEDSLYWLFSGATLVYLVLAIIGQ